MTDPTTFTSEQRSWEWDLVLQFEEGSLPPASWNEGTLTTVATWYAKNLSRDQATQRYQRFFQRNRLRLTNRLGSAPVTSTIAAVDVVWESLLTRAFDSVT